MGIYNRSFSAKGNCKKYIRSLASQREAAEDEIIRVWGLAANLEERFSSKFSTASEQLKSYYGKTDAGPVRWII